MAPSGYSPNERLLRKRLAARLRQRRCRERKRELIMSGIVATRTGGAVETSKSDSISIEGTASADNSTGYSSTKSTPASSPSKVDPVYVNIQNMQPRAPPPQGGYGWTYPVMPPIPRNRAPQPPHQANFHHSQHQPPVPSHSNGYYVPPPHHHHHHQQHYHQPALVPMMYPHHPHPYMAHGPHHSHLYPPQKRGSGSHGPPPYPVSAYGPPLPPPPMPPPTDTINGTCQASVESGPGDVSRTVSRSPSDASMNSGKAAEAAAKAENMKHEVNKTVSALNTETASAYEMNDANTCSSKKQKTSHKDKKNEKSLMSTEKAAVAAMLAMKTSSDESDGDSISAITNKRVSRSNKKIQESTSQQQQQQHALSSISLLTSA